MSKQTEALKLALECIEAWDRGVNASDYWRDRFDAITAIREVLAQPETVSPGGGYVPPVHVAVYGYCPICGGAGVMRERRPNGDDKCTNGHKYPSSDALAEQPAQHTEPCGWRMKHNGEWAYSFTEDAWDFIRRVPKAQQQEPVAWADLNALTEQFNSVNCGTAYRLPGENRQPLYTSPQPSKPWVWLSTDEIYDMYNEPRSDAEMVEFARAIEAKLREKNT